MICTFTSHSFDTCMYVPVGSIYPSMVLFCAVISVHMLFLGHVALRQTRYYLIIYWCHCSVRIIFRIVGTAHVDCWYHRTVRCLSWSWKYVDDLLILDCGYKPVSVFDDVTDFLWCDEQYDFPFLLILTPFFPCNGVICYALTLIV